MFLLRGPARARPRTLDGAASILGLNLYPVVNSMGTPETMAVSRDLGMVYSSEDAEGTSKLVLGVQLTGSVLVAGPRDDGRVGRPGKSLREITAQGVLYSGKKCHLPEWNRRRSPQQRGTGERPASSLLPPFTQALVTEWTWKWGPHDTKAEWEKGANRYDILQACSATRVLIGQSGH